MCLNTPAWHPKRGHQYHLRELKGSKKLCSFEFLPQRSSPCTVADFHICLCFQQTIHNHQFKGFPSPDKVQMFYTEHNIDGLKARIIIINWIDADGSIQSQ
ncbi:hypothetical protein KEM48_003110 [Puccinia striiformis f. sp. tritici PST-130]|nr:hypothetical protein KEM48_003110 [Puccinia striiformis f. sp. tritici PST-130]